MVFPLIPIIIGGIALITGGVGVKMGLDAKSDFDEAQRVNDRAKARFDTVSEALDVVRIDTNSRLESLGELRLKCFEGPLARFVEAYGQIKNVKLSALKDLGSHGVSPAELKDLRQTTLQMVDFAQGLAGSLSGGALAGVAAYGSVGLLATTSGGTAIAGLSGAAAQGATLAWLGGGSLAAGGMGVAGGTAILGGIVAGPVLLIGGLLAAAKAEEAKENAYTNLNKAMAAVEQMAAAELKLNAIAEGSDLLRTYTAKLQRRFVPCLNALERLVDETDDWRRMNETQRQVVYRAGLFAKAMKIVLDAPVLNESGAVSKGIEKVIGQADALVADIGRT